MNVTSLSAEELVTRVRSLNAEGNRLLVKLLVHLGEVDRRALYKKHACSSMFAFCRKLGMSEGSAARRIDAARAIRKFPSLLPRIESGELHLTTLSIVCSILTPANIETVIDAVVGRSRLEVEELKVLYAPKAPVRDLIRKMPEPAISPPPVAVTALPEAQLGLVAAPPPAAPPSVAVAEPIARGVEPVSPAVAAAAPPLVAVVPAPARAPVRAVTPLREDAYKVQLMANKAVVSKIEHAKEMMRHRNPMGDLATIVDAALDLLIAKLEKERFGKTERPRKEGAKKRPCKPGHVDIETRRQLFERDGFQCTFVDAHGHRCCERGWLEIDHIEPKALGGADDLGNLRIRCRAHNMMAAKEVFGAEYVDRRIQESKAAKEASASKKARVSKGSELLTARGRGGTVVEPEA